GATGHVLSTLGVYALIGAARLVEPNAFASVVNVADFGFSAMIAAWIGAIASVYWQRWPTCRARLLVVAGCLASLGIGLACRPDVTILDSEHLLAFAVGVALADPRLRRRLALPSRLLAAVTATRAAALVPTLSRGATTLLSTGSAVRRASTAHYALRTSEGSA